MEENAGSLIRIVAEATLFNKEQYPEIERLSYKQERVFKIRHSTDHLLSSLGSRAKIIEAADHGEELNISVLQKKTIAQAFSILRLCEVLGISGEALVSGIKNMVEDEKSKLI